MRKPPWYGNSQWHGISGAYAGLANELTGVARRFILGMPVDWLSYAGGPSLERLTWSTTTARDDRPPDQVLQVRKKETRRKHGRVHNSQGGSLLSSQAGLE